MVVVVVVVMGERAARGRGRCGGARLSGDRQHRHVRYWLKAVAVYTELLIIHIAQDSANKGAPVGARNEEIDILLTAFLRACSQND